MELIIHGRRTHPAGSPARSGIPRHRNEPFKYVSSGLEAWQAENYERAERLLRQGVDAYRRTEPDGVDFALGRLGAYLLDRGRVDEAAAVLDEAITTGTVIPAILDDYLDIMTRRRDVDGLFDIAMRWHGITRGVEQPWDVLLAHARRADRAGDSKFVQQVAERVVAGARRAGDQQTSWTAIGVLGHILERADQLNKALDLWTAAFNEGSDDPTTANRLSMHCERARDYLDAIVIIEEALVRHLPAATEEQLRKRLERCRARTETRTRRDVPSYSVRVGEEALQCVFHSRVSPAIRTAQVQGSVARCFGVSKGVGTVVDVSLTDGSEVGRYTDLPAFGAVRFSPDEYGLGTVQKGRVGSGVTTLTFLAPDLTELATSQVPDAISEFAAASTLWYVGCRDGHLYAFRQTGELLWRWETPGSRDHDGDAYSRPCPYYVASDGQRAVVSSMSDIYCIAPNGATMWHFQLPSGNVTSETGSIPIAELMFGEHAHAERSTHDVAEKDALALEFSITISGMEPIVSHLTSTGGSVLIGSSDGRLLSVSSTGQLRDVFALAKGLARPVLDNDGTLVAAYSNDALFRREGDQFRRVSDVGKAPDGVGVWSDGLYMWDRKRLDVLSRTGQVVSSVEFSKNVSTAVMHEGRLVCAAGVLVAFDRRGGDVTSPLGS